MSNVSDKETTIVNADLTTWLRNTIVRGPANKSKAAIRLYEYRKTIMLELLVVCKLHGNVIPYLRKMGVPRALYEIDAPAESASKEEEKHE